MIGGPVGRHALIGRQRFFTPVRVLLALALVLLSLGWFTKVGCIQQGPVGPNGSIGLDWSGQRQYTAMCYSDIVPLYGAEHLDEGAFPYKKLFFDQNPDGSPQPRYMEYPVVAGLYQYVVMMMAKAWDAADWLPGGLQPVIYFDIAAVGLALAWLTTLWACARIAGRRVWDAALIACSPLVAVHAFTNFDALATACTAGALLAWAKAGAVGGRASTQRLVLAGVLLGVGGATKLYPLMLLLPMLALCVRSGKTAAWRHTAAAAAATWTAVNLPIALLYPHGWWEFFRLNTQRNMDPDSIYNVIASFTGWAGFDPGTRPGQAPAVLNAVSLVLFAAVCLGVVYLALTAPRRPRLAQLAFLLIAGFLLTNKVWSPQYSLWLVPLAVLALPHRRILLAWMAVDAFVWVPRMYFYLGPDHKGLPQQWFTTTVLIRDMVVVVLCALVIRQIYRPQEDLVRYGFVDDPTGGVLDQAPDAPPHWLPPAALPQARPAPTPWPVS
ncbi:MAG: DUF2029 domain-containing protein [Mycobacteriaceae bacterium]|nr:DUF2029 domain-containing protein [Mycobacteriaceae bacterium]